MTREGFLICEAVPIGRTGDYIYLKAEGQSPGVEPDDDGEIISYHPPEVVFDPATLASFEGKPVTLDHPPVEEVTPADWKQYAVGHVSNVRRGEGDNADKIIADLVISDAAAIDAINNGLREVSCGYDAYIVPDGKGHERIDAIRGNHVALVQEGRAGHDCAIQDSKPAEGGPKMDEKGLFSFDQLKALLSLITGKPATQPAADCTPAKDTEPDTAKDQDTAKTNEGEGEDVEALKARIAELEAERDALKAELESDLETELVDSDEEVIVETGEGKADSAPLGFANRIEILAPGMRFDKPAKTDAKADARKVKLDAMRRALDRACDDDMKRDIIMSVAGKKVDSWYGEKDARVARVFKAASAALACVNDARIPAPVAHADSAASNADYTKKVMDRYAEFAKGGKR